jgi:hypothetical protein
MASTTRGLLVLFLVVFSGAARGFCCFLLVGSGEGFVGGFIPGVSSFPFSDEASFLSLLFCERVGPLVIPGGCFGCGAAGGGTRLFRSPASRAAVVDLLSPLFLAATVADFCSTSLIRLDGRSRRWLLRRFQGLDPICRLGGGFSLLRSTTVGGGRERGRRSLKKDLVVIFLSFKVLDVKWGCAVHPY